MAGQRGPLLPSSSFQNTMPQSTEAAHPAEPQLIPASPTKAPLPLPIPAALHLQKTKPTAWIHPHPTQGSVSTSQAPALIFSSVQTCRAAAPAETWLPSSPARYRVWEFLLSGTLSDRSQGCIPRNFTILLTASVKEQEVEQALHHGCLDKDTRSDESPPLHVTAHVTRPEGGIRGW